MAIKEYPIIEEFPVDTPPIQEFPASESYPGLLSYIKEHPFKTALQPIGKTFGGKSSGEVIKEKFTFRKGGENWTPAFIRSFLAGVTGDVSDIATTPASYIPIPVGKVTGKIPIGKTTLGEIATKVPIEKGAIGKVSELLRGASPPTRGAGIGIESIPITNTTQALQGLPQQASELKTIGTGVGYPSPTSLPQPQDPVKKIIQALQEAKPIRGKQEALYTTERAKRAGAIEGIAKTTTGEAGYQAQLGALKGELPKVQFEGIRNKIGQTDIDSLFNMVQSHPTLTPYEKISAKTGLAQLLGEGGGSVPTASQLNLLGKVFPPEFIATTLSKRTLIQKLGQGLEEVLNVPRAVMASADMSAPLRQGIFLIGRPKQWMPAFRDMFKYAFKEKAYQGLMADIEKRPTYLAMKDGGLSFTDIGTTLVNREEKFMSNLAERIPVLGHIVRGSNRAYTGFLNKLRADVFDDLVGSASKQGLKVEGKLLTDISSFVNAATGRGKLGALEKAAVVLNSTLFSPRLMASRINLLNPLFYTKMEPFARKEALKSLMAFAGTATSVISLAKMGGADVGVDPRSADFGKIKIGNTRYDVLGGFQQYIRLGAQLATGQHVSSTTGVVTTMGEGYKPLTRFDILGRFLETKEAPVVSFATALLKGQNLIGEPTNIPQEIGTRFIPMVIQDMQDLYKERGLEGLGMAVPGIFGVGLQTYSPTPSEVVYSTNSVKKHVNELLDMGKIDEARKLYLRNQKLIGQGETLEPLQKELNKVKKAKDAVIKDVRITPEEKKQALTYADDIIKKFTDRMSEKYKEIK